MISKKISILISFFVFTAIAKDDQRIELLASAERLSQQLNIDKHKNDPSDALKIRESLKYNPMSYSNINLNMYPPYPKYDEIEILKRSNIHESDCIDCEINKRGEVNVDKLIREGNCVKGWCAYPGTDCIYGISCKTWYNCIPDGFSGNLICPRPEPKTSPTPTFTSSLSST
ncbi:hypothetical protein AYI70_g11842, partial [Smittium culicis]